MNHSSAAIHHENVWNRRLFPRTGSFQPFLYSIEGAPDIYQGSTVDLGLTGARVVLGHRYERGQLVQLQFATEVNQEVIRVEAETVWVNELPGGKRFVAGVTFNKFQRIPGAA